MFDLARIIGLIWFTVVVWRGRAWHLLVVPLVVAYILTLEIVSGITIRGQGPMMPALSMVLIFVGPSAMPRGPLPTAPLAHAIMTWPSVVDGLACAVLAVLALKTTMRATALPVREEELIQRATRIALALVINAVAQALIVAIRVLPPLLGGELGSGNEN